MTLTLSVRNGRLDTVRLGGQAVRVTSGLLEI
jgi:hypothetical protein